MSGPGGGSAHDRLAEEARATASALLEWLGSRVDEAAAPGGPGARPAQSPGPCTWCPVCALVAALRGEQPELTARLAEQASGMMMLLRAMVQAHDGHEHPGHHTGHQPGHHPGHQPGRQADPGSGATPPGWPPEWGTPSWPAEDRSASAGAPAARPRPRRPRTAPAPGPVRRPRSGPRREPAVEADEVGETGASASSGAGPPHEEGRRPARPGPRSAPARTTSPRTSPRTTSPRTAAPRPSPRASSMPAPGPVPDAASEPVADPPAPEPPAPDPPAREPDPTPEPGPARPPAAGAPAAGPGRRSPVQSIAVRRRPDRGS